MLRFVSPARIPGQRFGLLRAILGGGPKLIVTNRMEPAPAGPPPAARPTQSGPFLSVPGTLSVVAALAAGFALRAWMYFKFPQISGDPLIYGGLAKNLLLHHQFAISDSSGILHPTLIRLPGYPLFLAACFRILGMENYAAATWLQIVLDLAGCLMLADFVRRIAPSAAGAARPAAHITLWLAALCPFSAVYAGAPLTEAPTLFVLALAMWSMARFAEKPGWKFALLFTAAVTYAALLRP